jgi:hypothetical protein
VQESDEGRECAGEEEIASEESMTLCIAAECWLGNMPCIVSCCDSRAERGGVFQELVGSEDVNKFREMGPVTALLSGDETAADVLVTKCEEAIKKFSAAPVDPDSDLAITQYLLDLQKVAELRKAEIVDHHLSMTLRMSYVDFVKQHRGDFHESHSREIWNEIKHIDLGTDVILCGFSGPDHAIVRLDRYGKTHWENNYSVVGVGADIALAFLCQRDWYEEDSERLELINCLYRVYEAKVAAQKNRHVGETTAFEILMPGAHRFDVTDSCFKDLKDRYYRRLKPPVFKQPMKGFLKVIEDEDERPETKVTGEAELIPIDAVDKSSSPLSGKSFGRKMTHDALTPELKAKIEELTAKEGKK